MNESASQTSIYGYPQQRESEAGFENHKNPGYKLTKSHNLNI